jgi:hypothetical protein
MSGIYAQRRHALGQPGGVVWDLYQTPIGSGIRLGYMVEHPTLGFQTYWGASNVLNPRAPTPDERKAVEDAERR